MKQFPLFQFWNTWKIKEYKIYLCITPRFSLRKSNMREYWHTSLRMLQANKSEIQNGSKLLLNIYTS